MFTKNGLAFMPTGGCDITKVPEGTPFLYKGTVCFPHSSFKYTRCTDYFTSEEIGIDDSSVYVTLLKVVADEPSTTPTEAPTADAERLAALEDRVSELESLVKLLIKNS